ncbi:MAG: SycD/LcrH family type III secretion system chaperone [Acetobacteraceae bacterium]|nr:SycD/LcrH family type III secretion system chaperone [Pseudomonadota bacterium]
MSSEAVTNSSVQEGVAELAQVMADITDGRTDLAQAAGLSDQDLEALYSVAHGFYAVGKYQEALNFFQVLCLCRQTDGRFWFGLGAACQMLDKPGGALRAYAMAALFDLENPQISLRAAECLIKLGDLKTARAALDAVIELSGAQTGQPSYRERARLMLQQLDRSEAAA